MSTYRRFVTRRLTNGAEGIAVTGPTVCDEIADGIYRISTHVADLVAPSGLTVNQFLVLADRPFLFHTGFRQLWPQVAGAIARIVPVERLRWISFGHVEADECGAIDGLLAAAPEAHVAFGSLGCAFSLRDLIDRPAHAIGDGGALDLGGRRVRFLATPHAPHNWEAQVVYEETTRTLLCGDLFMQAGECCAVADDVVTRALETEQMLGSATRGPTMPATLRRIAQLEPQTLAVMHGASYSGDGGTALRTFASAWEEHFGTYASRDDEAHSLLEHP
jgi:flavorubredoxin